MRKKGIGLASAFRSITIIPVWGKESESICSTLYWFVSVGLLLGSVSYFIALFFNKFGSPLLGGLFAVITLAFLSRGFHLDGVCDTADGFGGGFTKDRVLEIMKDSTIGSFGAISVTLLIISKVIAAGSLFEFDRAKFIIVAAMVSRLMAVFQSVFNKYAKEEETTAATLVTGAKIRHLTVPTAMLFAVVLCFKLATLGDLLLLIGGSLLITALIAFIAYKKIGGITGDILGVTVEFSELVCLLIPTLSRNLF
ncbi:MAG: adenosylcobinamide-GDP ribazoletransferase [Sphaerochaetaceae bacterium]|jgi:adenosylcobinamide-GDP ribazoletransferase